MASGRIEQTIAGATEKANHREREKRLKNLRAHQSIPRTLHPHYVVCTGFSQWAMEIRFWFTFSCGISEKSVGDTCASCVRLYQSTTVTDTFFFFAVSLSLHRFSISSQSFPKQQGKKALRIFLLIGLRCKEKFNLVCRLEHPDSSIFFHVNL